MGLKHKRRGHAMTSEEVTAYQSGFKRRKTWFEDRRRRDKYPHRQHGEG